MTRLVAASTLARASASLRCSTQPAQLTSTLQPSACLSRCQPSNVLDASSIQIIHERMTPTRPSTLTPRVLPRCVLIIPRPWPSHCYPCSCPVLPSSEAPRFSFRGPTSFSFRGPTALRPFSRMQSRQPTVPHMKLRAFAIQLYTGITLAARSSQLELNYECASWTNRVSLIESRRVRPSLSLMQLHLITHDRRRSNDNWRMVNGR